MPDNESDRTNLVAATGGLTGNDTFALLSTARVRVHRILVEVTALSRRRRMITVAMAVRSQQIRVVWRVRRRLEN